MMNNSIYDIALTKINGNESSLADYQVNHGVSQLDITQPHELIIPTQPTSYT